MFAKTIYLNAVIYSNIFLLFLADSPTLIHMEEQRSAASTSQRIDTAPLATGIETAVETTRQERTPEEDIIGIFLIF